MNSLSNLLANLEGRRTYLVAAAAVAYLVICQFTGKKPDETIIGIFGALGLAALRAGFAGQSATGNGSTSDAPAKPAQQQTPPTQGNLRTWLKIRTRDALSRSPMWQICGIMLGLVLIIPILTGCTINRPHMKERTTVTTTNGVTTATERNLDVTSLTLWPAKESVAGQKASLGKTMSTGVESLQQEGGGTNMVGTIQGLVELLKLLRQ